ncbi:MAG: hypothetical protein ACE5DQ_01990, partial [Candidatus Paceibacterota bacterium]
MTSYKAGFINSLTLAAFAVIAVVATAVLVSNPNSSSSLSTQAQVARRNVKLVQNSITPYALKDTNGTPIKNKLGLTGQICFGSQLRTGSEQWTLWATSDTGGRRYLKERGSSAHVHHGHFDTAPGYPGPCSVVNRDTGEAILENLGPLQNNTFNLVLTFPQDLKQGEYCPDLYLHYRSNRQGGLAFAKVSLSDITTASGNPVCSPGNVEEPTPEASTPGPGEPGVTFIPVSTRPTRRASVNPTREPLEPTAEPTPSSP